MHLHQLTATIVAVFCLTSPPALSGTLTTDQYGSFAFEGDIINGDAEKIIHAYSALEKRLPLMRLTLNSPGGDVVEALRIAQIEKSLHLAARVKPGGICASACFLIFLAGEVREADGGDITYNPNYVQKGRVGLHRPYLSAAALSRLSSSESQKQQKMIMKKSALYLQEEGLSQRLIDIMMNRPSNAIYWMTHADLQELGTYSAGFEELLIAKCGYTRGLWQQLFKASNSPNPDEVRAGKQREDEYRKCRSTASPNQQTEISANLNRLRAGWRPWESQIDD